MLLVAVKTSETKSLWINLHISEFFSSLVVRDQIPCYVSELSAKMEIIIFSLEHSVETEVVSKPELFSNDSEDVSDSISLTPKPCQYVSYFYK